MSATEYALERLLKAKEIGTGHVTDVWVRFGTPERIGVRSPSGDQDTKVQFTVETCFGKWSDHAAGGDDVSAMLGALVVAKAYLEKIERQNRYEIYWLEPGDLQTRNFWGFEVRFVSEGD